MHHIGVFFSALRGEFSGLLRLTNGSESKAWDSVDLVLRHSNLVSCYFLTTVVG